MPNGEEKNKSNGVLVAGLDIGTTKIVTVVGEVYDNQQIKIIGIGTCPSRGLKHGVIVNIDETVSSIQKSVEDAELMADCRIDSVYAGIAGSHIKSLNSRGTVAITNREVSEQDIERVLELSQAMAIPADEKVIHVVPQEFIIDQQRDIKDPIGMSGVRMEAMVHIVRSGISAVNNIDKCVRLAGLTTDGIVLEQIASSYAVLSEDEKEMGVCMVDIGGGTTDIAVFIKGAICHTAVIPVAGDQVTNDISYGLRTSLQHAEDIKVKYGCALDQLVQEDETIKVPGSDEVGERSLERRTLVGVIAPRYEELFEMVQAELRLNGFEQKIRAGIVLTGGSSKMEGLVELAEEVFHMPIRRGVPRNLIGLADVVKNPIYATSVGLVRYADEKERQPGGLSTHTHSLGVWDSVKGWFQTNL